ncbi:MAG: c-type cytochrome domain-containing protein, partial [Opitutales bacterium]
MDLRRRIICSYLAVLALALLGCSGESSADGNKLEANAEVAADRFTEYIEPILTEYCYDCHGDGADKGDVAFDAHTSRKELVTDAKLWKRVWENLHRRNMPPGRKPQPENEERERVLAWIEREV